jgi:hydrogenase-4 component B
MSLTLILAAVVLMAVSGVPGLFLGRNSGAGQKLAALLILAASAVGLAGLLAWFLIEGDQELTFPWAVPGGEFAVALDSLAAVFLVPVLVIAPLGAIYGLDYWRQAEHPDNTRGLCLFYGLLATGMALLVVAQNAVLFLAAWEVMALAGFFLVTTEDKKPEVREAGWVYLVATHTATLALVALFALLRQASGTFTLKALAAGTISPGLATAVFLLAVIGFGLKAGIMPLHVWLPGAHAMAPSHVSAILSGVMLKMGIYGLVRVTGLLPGPPAWWGGCLLVLGAISGILGVAYAIGQHDLKRLLAYHSIENIGIIVMGIGLAMLGRSLGRDEWILLGMAAALLHVWNHALFKSLLFYSAGAVIHATGTRAIDQLGGLARRMPATGLAFLVGAVAICGLPPLNGLVSELLLYLGLFHTLDHGQASGASFTAFAAPALALIGALALACFVKVYGVVFLGQGRSPAALRAHEAGPFLLGPMAILAGMCFLIGLAPSLAVPLLQEGAFAWAQELTTTAPALATLAPLGWVSVIGCLLMGLVLVGAVLLRNRLRVGGVAPAGTWDCGYAAPSARMQYTASSFAEMIVGLFAWGLRPRTHAPHDLPLFPTEAHFHCEVDDAVLDEAARPAFRLGASLFGRLRFLQQGGIQTYLLYIFAGLVVLLLWR